MRELVTEKYMSGWLRLIAHILVACMLTAILLLSFWISGHRYESESLKIELAEQREEITQLKLSEGAAQISLKDARGDVTRAVMDKATAEQDTLVKELALVYAKEIILKQANHIEGLGMIMDNFEVPCPEMLYPTSPNDKVFDELFGEEE